MSSGPPDWKRFLVLEAANPEPESGFMRALPEMAGLSDEAITLKLHSEYPEIPIEKIANDLGIPLSPSLQRAASAQR